MRPWILWSTSERAVAYAAEELLVEVKGDLFAPLPGAPFVERVCHATHWSGVSLWEKKHTYLLSTRHPESMCRTLRERSGYDFDRPVEKMVPFAPITDERGAHPRYRDFAENEIVAPIVRTQAELKIALPFLRATPSGCRALILEPGEALAFRPTDFGYWACSECGEACDPDAEHGLGGEAFCAGACDLGVELGTPHRWIDWIILRGQTGPAAVPSHPLWMRSLVTQAARAGVPVTFRGWGEHVPDRLEFPTFSTWVNKARTWLHEGAITIDTGGNRLRQGTDFRAANEANPSRFPVAIFYQDGLEHVAHLLDGEALDDRPELAR